jgi:hypothetical protein
MVVAERKKKNNQCSRQVRDLPLERFRLPADGRKWKSTARDRAAVLLHISQWSNGDGTFLRDVPGSSEPRNYSPSEKRLTLRFAKATLYRRTKELWILDLLDWDRPKHHFRRIYTVTPDTPYPFSPREKHVSDSDNRSQVHTEHVSGSQEHVPQLETDPSCNGPSGLPSEEKESAAQTAASSVASIALPDWIPSPQWNEFLRLRKQRKKPITEVAQELLVKRLCELRDAGDDPEAVLEKSILNGWPDLWPLRKNGTEQKHERLGLSRFGSHTRGDYNARLIRNYEAVGLLPRGTYDQIELKLLARGTNFANDPDVVSLCEQIGTEMFRQMASNN